MKQGELKTLTGKTLRGWYTWLRGQDSGCCSLWYASTDKYRYCVCVGWHDYGDGPKEDGYANWKICWKIGRQTHANVMQCDLDVDFEMPYVTEEMAKADPELVEGDVDDTLEEIECDTVRRGCFGYRPGGPKGYHTWNALATQMRKTARRVYRDWKDHDD